MYSETESSHRESMSCCLLVDTILFLITIVHFYRYTLHALVHGEEAYVTLGLQHPIHL